MMINSSYGGVNILAACYVILCFVCLLSHAKPTPDTRSTYTPGEDFLDQLPDYADPVINKQLRCSSCKALTTELLEQLAQLKELRHGNPKAHEIVSIFEDICTRVRDHYGLLMKNNKPTTTFSRNADISRIRGSWINTFLEGRCGEIMTEYEERIVEKFHKDTDFETMQQLICNQWDKTCSEDELLRDEF